MVLLGFILGVCIRVFIKDFVQVFFFFLSCPTSPPAYGRGRVVGVDAPRDWPVGPLPLPGRTCARAYASGRPS